MELPWQLGPWAPVQTHSGGGKADGARPEIFLRIVALQPGADGVALAHVDHVALTVRARPQQQVHPGLRQLEPGLDLRQQRTREHQRLADPVGLVDDAQAVGVAVGDEDAEGERGLHLYLEMYLMKGKVVFLTLRTNQGKFQTDRCGALGKSLHKFNTGS